MSKQKYKTGIFYFRQVHTRGSGFKGFMRYMTALASASNYHHCLFYFEVPQELDGTDIKMKSGENLKLKAGNIVCPEAHVKEGFGIAELQQRIEAQAGDDCFIERQRIELNYTQEEYVGMCRGNIKMAKKKLKYSKTMAFLSAFDRFLFVRVIRSIIYKFLKKYFNVSGYAFCSCAVGTSLGLPFSECIKSTPEEICDIAIKKFGAKMPSLILVSANGEVKKIGRADIV